MRQLRHLIKSSIKSYFNVKAIACFEISLVKFEENLTFKIELKMFFEKVVTHANKLT